MKLASTQIVTDSPAAKGLVMRPVEEARSQILDSGRWSARVISARYALKHGE